MPKQDSFSASPGLAEGAVVTKAREKRHEVVLRARMQTDGPYVDVCIRNISARGMMLEAPTPPRVGEYVELFGTVTAVGRVVWTDADCFGIATRDRVNLPVVLGKPEPKRARGPAKLAAQPQAMARTETSDTARMLGRAIDFTLVSLAAVALAGLFALLAYGVLSRPFDALGNLLR